MYVCGVSSMLWGYCSLFHFYIHFSCIAFESYCSHGHISWFVTIIIDWSWSLFVFMCYAKGCLSCTPCGFSKSYCYFSILCIKRNFYFASSPHHSSESNWSLSSQLSCWLVKNWKYWCVLQFTWLSACVKICILSELTRYLPLKCNIFWQSTWYISEIVIVLNSVAYPD